MRRPYNHHFSRQDVVSYSREVKRTLWIVLVFNWAIALLKLVVGYLIRSASLIADGYHSFADGSSNIIGLAGMRIAGQPRDKDHPYGHKKYETFASIFIGLLLILICVHILRDSFERFQMGGTPRINLWSFLAVACAIAVNVCVMLYERRKGRRLGSDILVADSMHTRSDILTSCSVIVSFIAVKMGFVVFDVLIALLIVVFIGSGAYGILRHACRILCDTAVVESAQIQKVVLSVKGVKRCHQIRTRGRQDDIYIDLHVLVEDRMPIVTAHDLSSKIEEKLKERFSGVSDVVIHIEPLSSEGTHEGEQGP